VLAEFRVQLVHGLMRTKRKPTSVPAWSERYTSFIRRVLRIQAMNASHEDEELVPTRHGGHDTRITAGKVTFRIDGIRVD
jgi:hypothetical protein